MIASLIGLLLMVWNSSVEYKDALKSINRNKNEYFDFIRRVLMPSLSNSMTASLNSLKVVLGEFIGKFGQNLTNYTNSADVLNENIERQRLLLAEINRMNQAEMAEKIGRIFRDISESSDTFEKFHTYQKDLNNTIAGVTSVVKRMDSMITSFDNFSSALNVVIQNQQTSGELQRQFKTAIENHFPTGSDVRNMWREAFDELISDSKTVTNELNNQLKASTEYIKNFTDENKDIFDSFGRLEEVLGSLVRYTDIQASCYRDLKEEIKSMKETQIKTQGEVATLNADLLRAVNEMIKAVQKLNN